jgi:hypothetical protein
LLNIKMGYLLRPWKSLTKNEGLFGPTPTFLTQARYFKIYKNEGLFGPTPTVLTQARYSKINSP